MKKILITGGNRGIGLGIAKKCVELGHDVIIGSRNLEKGTKAVSQMSGSISAVQLDVDDDRTIISAMNEIRSKWGSIDVLINNAGVICSGQDAIDADLHEVKKIFQTNFFGAWQVSRAALPLLRKSKDPRIINMSSGMGALKDLLGGYAAYRLSKTAMNALTIQMSNELEGEISVNAMCPGWVRTEMGGSNAHRSVEEGADTAVWLADSPQSTTGKFFRDRKEIPW